MYGHIPFPAQGQPEGGDSYEDKETRRIKKRLLDLQIEKFNLSSDKMSVKEESQRQEKPQRQERQPRSERHRKEETRQREEPKQRDASSDSLKSTGQDNFKLKSKYKDLDLGENFTNSQKALESYRSKIRNLKLLAKQPDAYISEQFNPLKASIEEEKIKFKKEVDLRFKTLLDEVSNTEIVCKGRAQNVNLERELNQFENVYKRLKGDLDQLKIDIKTWDNVTMEAEQQSSIISRIMDDLRNELTGNKLFVLESDPSGLKAGLQGVKIVAKPRVEAVSITVQKRPQGISQYGSFHFSKHGFKNFSETLRSTFHSGSYTFNGCKWFIELVNENGHHMSCYLNRTSGTSIKELKTVVKIQINNKKDSTRNLVKKLDAKFDQKTSKAGYDDFATFNDIYDRGFYDEENDMVDFSVYLQITD